MRDKKRIRALCSRLADAWEQFPDLRLVQLIGFAEMGGRDPYYMEDEELIGLIERIIKNANGRRDEE